VTPAPARAAILTDDDDDDDHDDDDEWDEWDEVTDVVVIGFGAAGTVAAVEAADQGARVVAIDRWGRGGASARSGGIVYGGGGTRQQVAAGFHDDPAQMAEYLALEEAVSPDDPRLVRFCQRSRDDLVWLEAQGVRFGEAFDPTKSVTPTDDRAGLYYSGNEKHHAASTPAVPRGHRVAGAGLTGRDLMAELHAAAARRGIAVRPRAWLTELVTDGGRVVGVDARVLDDDLLTRLGDLLLYRLIDATVTVLHRVPAPLARARAAFEHRRGRGYRIGARRGVVLATGGFSYAHDLVVEHAPAYQDALPLGTPGDDGSGIRAALRLGAGLASMDRCGASRFIAPPLGFCSGVLVDAAGERVCDESLYAATLSARITERGGRAWLIVDDAARREIATEIRRSPRLRDRALRQLVGGRANAVIFPRLFGTINLRVNRTLATDLDSLAGACGIPAEPFRRTIEGYNEDARSDRPDRMGKAAELVRPLVEPPFAAVPCHLGSTWFPAPCITLGGLAVDGATQEVLRDDGTPIVGLHAAGRAAAGIASRSYVSGLSLADCVYSGRNAGRAVAVGPLRSVIRAGGATVGEDCVDELA
jgi:3-oxo-5alpha-steroid 4-dehydrogenase